MKTVVLICSALIFGVTVWICWQNRASEQLKTNLLSGLSVGIIGLLVTTLLTLKSESRTVSFPTAFIYDRMSKLPFRSATQRYLNDFSDRYSGLPVAFYVQEATRVDASLLTSGELQTGQDFFLDVAAVKVIDTMCFAFGSSWNSRLEHSELITSHSVRAITTGPVLPCQVVDRASLMGMIRASALRNVEPNPCSQIALPPKTAIEFGCGEGSRSIALSNPFVRARITIHNSETSIGAGLVGSLASLSDDETSRLWTSVYTIEISAEFEKNLIGHPEMIRYKEWIDSLITAIEGDHDARRKWQSVKELHVLMK